MTESPQADMQDAFQAFMLGHHTGKKKKKNSTNNSSPKKQSTPKPSTPKPPATPIKESPSRQQHKQQQRSFQNLIQEWTETDDTLYALVCSVTDLRQRLYYTAQAQHHCITLQKENDEWKSAGFRPRPSLNKDPSSWLQPHDYDLALDHILLQHEKALQNIRRLLGQQSQTMDSMGRRLEFLLMDNTGEDHWDCPDRFRHLARELYRKQVLAQRLFASVQDNLLSSLEPWEIARAGQKEWRDALSS